MRIELASLGSWWNLLFVLPLALGALLCALSLPLSSRRGRVAVGRGSHGRIAGRGGRSGRKPSRGDDLPPLLWAQSILLWWGACGWGCNLLLGTDRPRALSFVAAGLGAAGLSIIGARLLSRLAPPPAVEATGRGSLEGRLGGAAGPIAEAGGTAFVRDERGTLHHARCFCDEPIARGQAVVLVAWDEAREGYRVRAWEPAA